jgi:hypothetical protein
MKNLTLTPEELAHFKLTPEARADASQRLCERLTIYISELKRELNEAEAELKKYTDMGFRSNYTEEKQDNRIKEVTAYRTPIPKKHYEYIEPKIGSVIGTDKDGKEVLWEGFTKRPTFNEMYQEFVEPSNNNEL